MPLPRILRVSSEFVLNNEIRRCLESEEIDLARMNQLLDTARQHGTLFRCKSALRISSAGGIHDERMEAGVA